MNGVPVFNLEPVMAYFISRFVSVCAVNFANVAVVLPPPLSAPNVPLPSIVLLTINLPAVYKSDDTVPLYSNASVPSYTCIVVPLPSNDETTPADEAVFVCA